MLRDVSILLFQYLNILLPYQNPPTVRPTDMANIRIISSIFFAIALLGQVSYVAAECCPGPQPCRASDSSKGTRQLFACSSTSIRYTHFACCGSGPCNIFCCNCDDGCIQFDSCPLTGSRMSVRSWPGSVWNPSNVSSPKEDDNCAVLDASGHACTRHKFDLLDSTIEKNGEITFKEFIQGWALINPHFDESIWDHPDAYTDAVKHFKRFDANGDGILSFEEALQKRYTY